MVAANRMLAPRNHRNRKREDMDKKDFLRQITVNGQEYQYYALEAIESLGPGGIQRLPFSIRILVENVMRKLDGRVVTQADLDTIASWRPRYEAPPEIPYHPARVLMQDFTGVPAVVDLAAMRDAVAVRGGNPSLVNPLVPVELVVDHSVQVDYFGTDAADYLNVKKEYERNSERYALLKWAQRSFDSFKVVPPRSGICHQVNLEYLGRGVIVSETQAGRLAYPDTLVGLDSHTTMIDALGVVGWGVGGIEAEAVMLGQPYHMSVPEVIGFKMTGRLRDGVTATDLVLTVTEILRKYRVVEKFVEFFGPGLKHLTLPDRATVSNMTPEFGATLGFFPVDEQTIAYLRATHRSDQADLVEAYCQANHLFYSDTARVEYTDVIELDLSQVEPCVAGPARPQDRIRLADLKSRFADILGCEYKRDTEMAAISRYHDESGSQTSRLPKCLPISQRSFDVDLNGTPIKIGDGSVVIAAITSCTNTSNPSVLLGAGLLAKKAVEKGLKVPPYVKTSLAPGSRVVMRYLEDAGIMPYLKALGFHLSGFGCTTCIGNSGPLHPGIEAAIKEHGLNVAAVLSGNRNFEARIHQRIKSNFLASPMLVVAFALAGHVDVDFSYEPVGLDPNGLPVYLEDIWPNSAEIEDLVRRHVKAEFYKTEYGRIFTGDEFWQDLPETATVTYDWDPASTYIKNPPYFEGFTIAPRKQEDIIGARALAVLGESVTTDHISPAGAIPKAYPNRLVDGKEGSFTRKFPEKTEMSVYDAAMAYAAEKIPLLVLAGREYGTGSSRDWAAKGTLLLGVRAVIARSFERIHRSNLVGMGVLPLVFQDGDSVESLGLSGSETFHITGIDAIQPRQKLRVRAVREDGGELSFTVTARLDTPVEVDYFRQGGIMPFVLRKMIQDPAIDRREGEGEHPWPNPS